MKILKVVFRDCVMTPAKKAMIYWTRAQSLSAWDVATCADTARDAHSCGEQHPSANTLCQLLALKILKKQLITMFIGLRVNVLTIFPSSAVWSDSGKLIVTETWNVAMD